MGRGVRLRRREWGSGYGVRGASGAPPVRRGRGGPAGRRRGRPSAPALAAPVLLLGLGVFARASTGPGPPPLPSQYVLRNWQVRHGLPQNSVNAVLQTHDGFLWFGTQAGLARFDGRAFEVFDHASSPALRHEFVRALLEDREGVLWVATNGGGLLRFDGRRFERVPLPTPGRRGTLRVFALAAAGDGSLCAGTDRGLACRYRGRWRLLGLGDGLPGSRVISLAAGGSDGGIWVGTDRGLARWRRGRLERAPPPVALRGRAINALLVDGEGALWAGTERGVVVFRGGRVAERISRSEGLPDGRVRALYRDPAGAVWIATAYGLVRWWRGRLAGFPAGSPLAHRNVLTVAGDREGDVWVGTGASGVYELVSGAFVTYGVDEGLADPRVRCVYEDRGGTLWIGTDAGLYRLDRRGLHRWPPSDGLPDPRVTSVLRDREGRLWVGTFGGGLAVGGHAGWRVVSTSSGLSHDVVTCLLENPDGSVWVGTGRGLDLVADGVVRTLTHEDGLPGDVIMFVHRARDGRLWVGTYGGGVGVRDGSSWRTFTTADGLADDKVICVHEDADGGLWFGTLGGGVSWYDGSRFRSVSSRQGLPDDSIFAILEDRSGDLWLSSQKGIFRVARAELVAAARGLRPTVRGRRYGEADGMRSRECSGGSQPAAWSRRDGTLWFATIAGAVAVDPAAARRPAPPPLVAVRRLVAGGRAYRPMGEITLPPGIRKVVIEFSGLGFRDPGGLSYRYRLDGFDTGWVAGEAAGTATYTALRPGRYRFRVLAVDRDGPASPRPATLRFRLLPRFYQTATFRGLVALGLMLALWGGYRWRLHRLAARLEFMSRLAEERRATAERLDYLAHHDQLTGLPNRLWFSEKLAELIREARSPDGGPVVIVLDLDGFKDVNTAFGHEVGDRILRRIAARLRTFFGGDADLCRSGGDEFAALVPRRLGRDEAIGLGERLLALFGRPFHVGGRVVRVTASVGVVFFPDDGDDADMLLRSCEVALAEAKRRGGATVSFSSAGMREAVSRRAVLKNELRAAIPAGELEVRYQPIRECASGVVVGLEALVRWRHPRLGILLPETFLDLAEEAGLVASVGQFVLREACLACVRWRAATRRPAAVTVNLSAREFQDRGLVARVSGLLAEVGLPPDALVLEVTETTAMWDIEDAVAIMRRLREAGIRLAIDDFGRGYSSLTYLKRFPVELLKVDRGFVEDMVADPAALGIVEGVIAIAHGLGVRVVAEGVENEAQLELLRASGCDLVQGFLGGRPVGWEEVDAILRGEPPAPWDGGRG